MEQRTIINKSYVLICLMSGAVVYSLRCSNNVNLFMVKMGQNNIFKRSAMPLSNYLAYNRNFTVSCLVKFWINSLVIYKIATRSNYHFIQGYMYIFF